MGNCDFKDNYLALFACIVLEMSVDESVRRILLQKMKRPPCQNGTQLGSHRRKQTVLIDMEENKETLFDSGSAIANYLGISRGAVSVYCASGKVYMGRYKFKIVEKSKV